jgi:hypothetical protein
MKQFFKTLIAKLYLISQSKVFQLTIFPYQDIAFEKNCYIPDRGMPEKDNGYRTLPMLFQKIWEEILKNEPALNESLKNDKSWVGWELLTIAKRYIYEEKREEVVIGRGFAQIDAVPITYVIKGTFGTEPSVTLTLSAGPVVIKLICCAWDMDYRPKDFEHKGIWFALCTEKNDLINGKIETIESTQLSAANFWYHGKVFRKGKLIECGRAICEVEYDRFTSGRHGDHTFLLKSAHPFIKKTNEHLAAIGLELPTS